MVNVWDIEVMKPLLAVHGFHFSKSMGQNFLIQDWVPRDIAEASGAAPGTETSGSRCTCTESACSAGWICKCLWQCLWQWKWQVRRG